MNKQARHFGAGCRIFTRQLCLADKLTEHMTTGSRAWGTDRDWLDGLLGYWAEEFDWRAAEQKLNSFGHYRVRIGEHGGQLVHVRTRHSGRGSR